MSALAPIWSNIDVIIASTDGPMTVAFILFCVTAGLLTRSPGVIGTTTVIAMAAFAVANFSETVLQGTDTTIAAETGWQKLLEMPSSMMMAYFLCFAVLVTISFLARIILFAK